MPVPSSGGIAVAEILNLIGHTSSAPALKTVRGRPTPSTCTGSPRRRRPRSPTATATSATCPGVPVRELTSQAFAAERACLLRPDQGPAAADPVRLARRRYTALRAGRAGPGRAARGPVHDAPDGADRWGNVASYTLTIEQTGGSGITVPGYGFLLNNELTDFDFMPLTPGVPDPNLPGPGKRPRSSMSPTIVLKDGRPLLASARPAARRSSPRWRRRSPSYLDRDLPLVDAIAAPRLSSRNGVEAGRAGDLPAGPRAALRALGHTLLHARDRCGHGIAAARRRTFEAAAEPTRRGGGSAMVVRPDGRQP